MYFTIAQKLGNSLIRIILYNWTAKVFWPTTQKDYAIRKNEKDIYLTIGTLSQIASQTDCLVFRAN